MRMLQVNNCFVLKDVLLRNDLDNFHNSFHQLLIHLIIHGVLSLMSRLFHIFSLSMLSFVSTSSMTVSWMLPVFRFSYPSSTLAHHWLHICASSNTFIVAFCSTMQYPAPIDRSPFRSMFHPIDFHTCNRPTIDLLRIFQTSPTHSQTNSTRLPGSFVSRITLRILDPFFDLTP